MQESTTDARGVVEVFDAPAYRRAHPGADLVTCGGCNRTWDDAVVTSWTPAPSARCPFEYDHPHLSEIVTPGTYLARVISPTVGCELVIFSRGRFRTAKVTAVGPKRVKIEYVTRPGGTVSRPAQPISEVYRTCYGDDPMLAGVVRQKTGRAGQYLED